MTADSKKFTYYPMGKPMLIQPQCPVYIYAYALAVQRHGGAAFAQVRLVNRSDRIVHSVFLRLEGKDLSGNSLYELNHVPVVDCMGQPHTTFGEEQPLFLPKGIVYSLDVEVLDVLFTDGMIWRKQAGHKLMTAEQARWQTCSCGMKNPEEASHCAYCRKLLKPEAENCEVQPMPIAIQEALEEISRETEAMPVLETVQLFPTIATGDIVPEQTEELTAVAGDSFEINRIGELSPTVTEEPAEEQTNLLPVIPAEKSEKEEPNVLPVIVAEKAAAEQMQDLLESPEDDLMEEQPLAFPENPVEEPTAEQAYEPTEIPEEEAEEQIPPAEEALSDIGEESTSKGYIEEEEISLASLLGVLRARSSHGAESASQPAQEPSLPVEALSSPVDESLSPVEESPTVEKTVPPTEESLQDDSGSETEASDTAETPNQWMQETERMLQEFRRRMEARQQGNRTSAAAESEPEQEGQPEEPATENTSTATRGVMFWVLMVILLIILGAAAFFGVLYFKGYFG